MTPRPSDHPLHRRWIGQLRRALPLLAVILLAAVAAPLTWTERRTDDAGRETACKAIRAGTLARSVPAQPDAPSARAGATA